MKTISFLRRPARESAAEIVSTPLHDRVQEARDRLAHQDDPALVEALSERELRANRELAERIRDSRRNEELAKVDAAEKASNRLRRTVDELADQQARDLIDAERAIAQQRHSSSPHTKVARLHRRRTLALRIVTSVLVIAMVVSAVSVQHNIAPTGGPANVWWWMAYGIEFLISGTLIALMMSTGDSAEWDVIEEPWKARIIENVLLGVTVLLNIFPYLKDKEWGQIGAHIIAPVIIGTALHTYSVIATRYSKSIERATAKLSQTDEQDVQARLAALTRIGVEVTDPRPAHDDLDRELAALTASTAREEGAPRAIAEPAPIARGIADAPRADDGEPRADGDLPRAEDLEPIAREDASARAGNEESARADESRELDSIARANDLEPSESRAAHMGSEQGTDRAPIADRESAEGSSDVRPVVTLVRSESRELGPRAGTDRARGHRAARARSGSVEGALARATDHAPRAAARGSGAFARVMSRAEAAKLARAVIERGGSRQPIDVLVGIYEAHSRGQSPTGIGKEIGLPHSTVQRAIDAANKSAGPRALD
ncbi:hypothetical protein ACWCPQ_33600 [Nocardia sp. NPDC001965]